MRLRSLLIAIVLSVSSPAYSLDDLLGWQTTRWGMTEEEVRGLLKSHGSPLTPLPVIYGRWLEADAPFSTTVEMAGSYYDAIFMFSKDTRRLGRVMIRTVDFSHEHALSLHDNLLRALTENYGRPTETQGGTASLTKWIFKTTTVVLSLYTETAVPRNPITQVVVIYAPSLAAAEDPRDKLLGLGLLRALGEAGRSAR
ncbi:MAG TPA: hypothetical protein VMS64_30565 [Candidatus Methylomirabilis sp.]|nr:hypothetical protein [Candidatus Methylomirabilis sp.]